MDSWQFVYVAERLLESCRTPSHPAGSGGVAADLRTSISRSYYATFLTSRSLLNDLGYRVTEKGACHGIVHRALLESHERDLIRAASEYATLGEYRRKADYDLQDADVESIDRAEDMLKLCEAAYSKIGQARIKVGRDPSYSARLIASIDAWLSRDAEKHLWK